MDLTFEFNSDTYQLPNLPFLFNYNHCQFNGHFPGGNYIFKVNNRNTRTRCEICSKLTAGIFVVNFEHISHLVLVFLLLTLSR